MRLTAVYMQVPEGFTTLVEERPGTAQKKSAVPRDREINVLLARKICRDL